MSFDLPLITDNVDVAVATKTAGSLSALREGSAYVGIGAGTANAQTIALVPPFTALTNGLKIGYKPTATNTGGMTIALDGLTAKSVLKRQAGALVALVAGDIVANIQADLTFVTQNDAWILDTLAQIMPESLGAGTIASGVNIPNFNFTNYTAGNNSLSLLANFSTSAISYTKQRETKIVRGGTLRIEFDLEHDGAPGDTGFARIYRNGVAVGTERSVPGAAGTASFTEDISGWTAFDLVQIYAYSDKSSTNTLFTLGQIRVDETYLTEAIV